MSNRITSFSGRYAFLSNFYYESIQIDEVAWKTNEHYFQAMKTLDVVEQGRIWEAATPSEAKRLGRRATLRRDWDAVKLHVMRRAVYAKFADDGPLVDALMATGDAELVEGNYWHDNFWGDCSCYRCVRIPGQNHLGKLLMARRAEIAELRK